MAATSVAISEVRELAHRYAVALDSRDLDGLVDLFVPDVHVGRDASGRDALREFFERSLADLGVTYLFVGTQTVDLDDADHAHGVVYCRAEVEDRREGWVHQAIVYFDTYERRDGRWLFARRDHRLVYGETQPASPLDQPPANWPERPVGRGTFPEDWSARR